MDYPYYCSISQGYPDDGEVPEGRCTPPRLFPGQPDDDDVPSLRFPDEAMEKLERLVGPCLDSSPRGQADSNLFPMQEPYCPVEGSCSSSLGLPRSQTKVTKPRKKKRDSVCQARAAEDSTFDWGQAAAAAPVPLEGPLHMPHRLSDTTTPSSFSSPISLCGSFDPCQDNEPSTPTDGMSSAMAGDHRVPRQRKPKTNVKNMTPEEKRLHIRENNRSPSRRSREKKKAYFDDLSDNLQRLEVDNCRLNRHCQELEDEYAMWRTIKGIVDRSPVDSDPQAPPFSSSLDRHPF